jgi:hypothetical protein
MNKPLEVRFILDGRDWDEYTEEERERYRAWVTDRALQINLGPLEERYGSRRVGEVLRLFLQEWNKERAGEGPKVWERLMFESDLPWPMMLGRVIEAALIPIDKAHNSDNEVAERQPPLWSE